MVSQNTQQANHTIPKKEKKALLCYLFFDGTLSAECVQAILDYIDDQAHRIIGRRFPNGNRIECGSIEYSKKVSKDKVGAYLSQIPLPHWFLYASANLVPYCTQFGLPPKSFDFNFRHPREPHKNPDSSIQLDIEYTLPFDFTGEDIVELMHHWIALLRKEEVYIKYAYIEPIGKFRLQRHDQIYLKKPIPNDKLMGVRWGNLLTRQHLGEKPEELLAAINRAIAPEKIVTIGPDLYWFTLPFDLPSYCQATHPSYQAMLQKTLEAIKPYNVLWRKGIRRYF